MQQQNLTKIILFLFLNNCLWTACALIQELIHFCTKICMYSYAKLSQVEVFANFLISSICGNCLGTCPHTQSSVSYMCCIAGVIHLRKTHLMDFIFLGHHKLPLITPPPPPHTHTHTHTHPSCRPHLPVNQKNTSISPSKTPHEVV